MNRIIYRWKEYGDNQPISIDKVFCCPACGKGRLFKWQLTPFCPHCGLKLSKPEPLEAEEGKLMYKELVERLKDRARAFDYDGRPDIACDYEQAADTIEELLKAAKWS